MPPGQVKDEVEGLLEKVEHKAAEVVDKVKDLSRRK